MGNVLPAKILMTMTHTLRYAEKETWSVSFLYYEFEISLCFL